MTMPIQILGVEGYSKTNLLKINVKKALKKLNLRVGVEEISDVDRLMKFNITSIPALVVKDQVILENEIPSVEDLMLLLQNLFLPEQYVFRFNNILVPTDFSTVAANAYQYAKQLAIKRDATIKIVHIFHPEMEKSALYLSDPVAQGIARKKKRLAEFIRADPTLVEFDALQKIKTEQLVEVGFPGQKIVHLSKQTNVDLVVMGTTGSSGLFEKLFGSVSSYVAQKAYCPVLLVPKKVPYREIDHILYASNRQMEDEKMMKQVIDLAITFNASNPFCSRQ